MVVWQGYGAADPAGIYSQRLAPLSPQLAAGGVAPGGKAAAVALTVLTWDKIRAYPMARRGDLLVCWSGELKLRTNGGP